MKKERGLDSQPAELKVSHADECGYMRRDIHLWLDGKEFALL